MHPNEKDSIILTQSQTGLNTSYVKDLLKSSINLYI